jgi:Tol biopolymer transport system component
MARKPASLPPGSATSNFASSKAGVVFDAGLGHDTVLGSRHADLFQGGVGDDNLSGKKGDDTLQGGAGLDAVTGGRCSDTFVFAPGDLITARPSSNDHKGQVDTITDFQGAGTSGAGEQDVIRLEGFGAGTTLIYVGQEEPGRGSSQLYEVVDPTTAGADGFIAMSMNKSVNTKLTADDYVVEAPPGPRITITNITEGGNGDSYSSLISANGSAVVFGSEATNLVDGEADQNSQGDIFVYDVAAGEIINVTLGGNGYGFAPSISADGATVAFFSDATNLVDGQVDPNFVTDIFVYDVATGEMVKVTEGANGGSFNPNLSADGSTVAFNSTATNLVDGQVDLNRRADIFLYDLVTGEAVNVTQGANGDSYIASLSADGSTVAFESRASNLVDGQVDDNDATDIFIHDVTTGEMINVSQGTNGDNSRPTISADGSKVVFSGTEANGEDVPNYASDIFVYDVATGETVNITKIGNGDSYGSSISADGTKVAFSSRATNLVDGEVDQNGSVADIFVYDLATGETVNLTQGRTAGSFAPSISADGSAGTFDTFTGDGSGSGIFVWDWI